MGTTAESMSGTCERTLRGEGATARLGAALAHALGAGATVLLEGPLGAGKSALARALIRARLDEPGRLDRAVVVEESKALAPAEHPREGRRGEQPLRSPDALFHARPLCQSPAQRD